MTHSRFSSALLALTLLGCAQNPALRVSPNDVRDAEQQARAAVQMEATIRADTIPLRSIGVTPLRITGTDSSLASLGYGLADFIMADLAKVQQLVVVNRLRMDAVLRELELARTGRVDPATAPRVGKLIGAGRLVTGSIGAAQGENIGIGTQVVNSVTGAARPVVNATTSMNQLLRAQKELTFRILTELGVNITPAERASIEEFQTQNVNALVAYSHGVRYETEGRFAAAAREFRRASQIDPSFSLAGSRAVAMQSLSTALPVSRAMTITQERVNPALFNPMRLDHRSAADPSFPDRSIIIRITITTPP